MHTYLLNLTKRPSPWYCRISWYFLRYVSRCKIAKIACTAQH